LPQRDGRPCLYLFLSGCFYIPPLLSFTFSLSVSVCLSLCLCPSLALIHCLSLSLTLFGSMSFSLSHSLFCYQCHINVFRLQHQREPFNFIWIIILVYIHYSFIHSGYFYRASLSPLLLISAPITSRILCRSFTPKRRRQLRVKDLLKVSTWRLERESNP